MIARFLSLLARDPEEFVTELWARALGGKLVGRTALVVAAISGVVVMMIVFRELRERRLVRFGRSIHIVPPPEVEAESSRVFWMSVHGLLRPWWKRLLFGQPYLAWEMSSRDEEFDLRLVVPTRVPPEMIERMVTASWPGTIAEPLEDQRERKWSEVTELKLARPDCLPLGEPPGDDPLRVVVSALRSRDQGEEAMIQVLARPLTGATRKTLIKAARSLRGTSHMRGPSRGVPRPPVDPSIEGEVRAILSKSQEPLFGCSVRIAVLAASREVARGRIHGAAGAFSAFEGRNGFRRKRTLLLAKRIRTRRLRNSFVLSVGEISQIAAIPLTTVLGLQRAGGRSVPPTRAVPSEGRVLGLADDAVSSRPVAISVEDARHHLHIVGETGTGKSTLIASMVLQDAAAGRAAVVVDPKGDLIESVLERLPSGAEERTCLLDAEDPNYTVGLNVLKGDDPDLAVEDVLGIFRRIFEPYWGPRTDHVMRAACLTLKRIPGATLAEVPQLLSNREWRAQVIWRLRGSPGLNDFWAWFEKIPEHKRGEHTDALLNKVGAFLLRGPVRDLVGQANPKRDIESLIDTGGLLLVRIPKGTIGQETSRVIGALVVARVWHACMKRSALPESERPDSTLYVDEMHNYLALPRSFEDLLAEARGYRLSLVLAHQHMGQLNREMREALSANARTKVAFVVSPDDAAGLEKHFSPELTAYDLSHLAAYRAACRPSIKGGHGQAFTFKSLPLADGSRNRADEVRRRSNELFATSREKVDLEVSYRHRTASKVLFPVDQARRRARSGAHSPARSGAQSGARSSSRGAENAKVADEGGS